MKVELRKILKQIQQLNDEEYEVNISIKPIDKHKKEKIFIVDSFGIKKEVELDLTNLKQGEYIEKHNGKWYVYKEINKTKE